MVLLNFQNRSTYLNHGTENKVHIIFYLYTTTAQFLRKIWRHKWYHGESRKCTNGKNFIEVLMIPYQMTPNLMKAELISAMDSINHSSALYGHSNEDSSKKKNGIFLFFPHRAVIELFILFRQTFKTISKPKILKKKHLC